MSVLSELLLALMRGDFLALSLFSAGHGDSPSGFAPRTGTDAQPIMHVSPPLVKAGKPVRAYLAHFPRHPV
jgi:hypothetical protein